MRKTVGFIFSLRLIHLTSLTRARGPRVKPFTAQWTHSRVCSGVWPLSPSQTNRFHTAFPFPLTIATSKQLGDFLPVIYCLQKQFGLKGFTKPPFFVSPAFHPYIRVQSELLAHDTFDMNGQHRQHTLIEMADFSVLRWSLKDASFSLLRVCLPLNQMTCVISR